MRMCGSGAAELCSRVRRSVSSTRLLPQVWLQEAAWTEGELPKCLARRNSRAEGPVEAAHLQPEPMFCYETALKLLKWSSLAYTDLGQAPPEPSKRQSSSQNWCGNPGGERCKVKLCRQRLQASCKWLAPPSSSSSDGTKSWTCINCQQTQTADRLGL